MAKLPRRQFLFTAGAAAAASLLAHGCSNSPAGRTTTATDVSLADNAPEVETNAAKLGFIALTDSAPVIIALEKGFFAKYGMTDVEVIKQTSWPVTRDNLALGSGGGGIDGAHILSPMPYLLTINNVVPMYILARLNTNGQAISVANKFKDLNVQLDSKAMQEAAAQESLSFAMTYPGGTHDLWMRYWLAAGGINPDEDVALAPVPPPQMVANMNVNTVDSFCVGEPWNAQLVNQDIGYTALVTGELWNDHPEKAFAMRKDWVDQNPNAAKAMLMAILEAQQWCDQAENVEEMCTICSERKYFNVAVTDIIERSKGNIDYGDGRTEENFPYRMKFWADNASYPYKSHDAWFLTENIRWGYLPKDTNLTEIIDAVNKEDLWKQAAQAISVPDSEIPTSTSRGIETFFDGIEFDPDNPQQYLDSLEIKKA